MRILAAVFVVFAAVPVASWGQDTTDVQPLPSVELPPELDRVLRDYETLWAAGDAGGLAELFTEDGSVRDPGGWLRGRDAIRAKYQNASGPLRLRAVAYSVDDTAGYIVGAYGYGPDATFDDRGVFVLALRRSDADAPWLIAADLDNSINR